jgi:autotransporter-associated beta strand protein
MKKRSFKSVFPPVRSRSSRRKASAAIIGLLSALGALSSANAAVETWSGTASGTWDTAALNWNAGANTWTSGNDALFSGTPTNNVTTATGLTIGAITLDNTFTGSVTMSGANTVTGATTISGGTLNLNNATGLGTAINPSAITVNNGGTLVINPGTATVANNVSGAGALTLQDPTGTNTLTLSGVYSGFTGTVNILAGASNGGKVNFSNATQANVLSSSATVQIQNGATLYLNKGLNYGASVQILGAGNSESLGALRLEGGANQTGSVTLMGNSASIGVNATAATISGNIGESGGSFGFSKVGNSTLTLSGTNTYSGVTTMSAGTTQFAKEVSLYNNNTANWTTTNLVVASGATAAFNVGGTGEFTTSDINTLIGLGTATGGFKSGSAIGFDTTNAGGSFTYSSNIANTNAGANTLGVAKLGTGALTLSGTLSNTGGTTVSGGTLNYTASGSSLGALTVNNLGVNSTVNYSGSGTYAYNNANMTVGNNATAAGVVNQSSGTINGVNQLQIGSVNGAYGYYKQSGGTLGVTELDLGGFTGTTNGVMDISGGTFNDSTWLIVGRQGGGSTLLNMTGGTLNYTGTTANRFTMNFVNSGTESATLNIANATFAGTNATGGVFSLMLGTGTAGQKGTVNLLSGGLMQVQGLKAGGTTGTSTFNFNGGTLKASTANTTFMTGLSKANVYSGGGTIDNNSVNITVGQALLAPTGSGISSSTISVPSGGSGYVGAPIVTLSGGTGSGATGYATVSGGVVTGIVITSPGTGYTAGDSLTATFSGGGATVAASSVTGISVASNTSGGMTFSGSGVTTLSGANTYTGSTTITAGTLALANTGSLASTTFNVAAGATYDVSSQAYSLNGKAITLSLDAVNPGFIKDLGQTLTLTGGALTLNLTTASPGSSYALYSGTTSGDFSSILLTGSGFSGNLSFSGGVWTGTSNGFNFSLAESTGILSLTAVPESNAYGIAAGVFCLVILAARRRRAMLE